jgi:hypothetical protein
MRKVSFVKLLCGLLATMGVTACCDLGTDWVYYHSPCYDETTKIWSCCDPAMPPPKKPICFQDGGVDADVDASDDDGGKVDPDAGNASAGQPSSLVCPWTCTAVGGGGFDDVPSYVWLGDEGDPEPIVLGDLKSTSWVDVEFAEPNCPACFCVAPEDAEDGCLMPNAVTARSTTCQDNSSSTSTSFDPPANWTGSCTAANPIVADAMCDGVPCVKSLMVQPPTIAPCNAEPTMPPEGQPLASPKRTKVISYVAGNQDGLCTNLSANCIKPAPKDFKFCLVAYGEAAGVMCPNGWSERHTGWTNVEDKRRCSACACGAPEDGACYVRATVFSDDVCSDDFANVVVASFDEPACLDVPTGAPLSGKTAEVLSYVAGSCSPTTSVMEGEKKTGLAVTFCCGSNPEKQE